MSEVVPTLIREGHLRDGLEIFADYHGKSLTAAITSDGKVKFRGAKYNSPSAAGAAAKQFVTGKFMATDGWAFWSYEDGGGAKVPFSMAREQYLAKRKP